MTATPPPTDTPPPPVLTEADIDFLAFGPDDEDDE